MGYFSYADPQDLGPFGADAVGVEVDLTDGGGITVGGFRQNVEDTVGTHNCLDRSWGIFQRGAALPPMPGSAGQRFVAAGSGGAMAQGPVAAPSRIPLELATSAISIADFEQRLDGKEWVFFPRGVRSCDSSATEADYLPPGDDEFARRAAASDRESLRSGLVGNVVRFEGQGTMTGTDAVFDTISIGGAGGPFELYRSTYDFRRGRYTFHVVANSDSGANWGICLRGTCTPDIQPETFNSRVMQTIGSIGGRDVEVARNASETEWRNFSRIAIPVPMEEAVARRYATSMPVSIVVYMRFVELGFHQRCQRHCETFFGERVCGGDEMGMGVYKRSELLAYEVKVGGQVVADMVR